MKEILLDSSVLIDFLRRKDKKKSLLIKIIDVGYSPTISLITHAELFAGRNVWRSKKAKKELEEMLSGLKIIAFDEKTSQLAGKLRARYQISLADAFIAACAIEKKLPLSTLNVRDFKQIKGIKILEPSKGT